LFSFIRNGLPSYDLIVIDTPPVLALSDAAAIARIAHIVLFVVKWGDTPRQVVLAGLEKLEMHNLRVDGIIMSHVDMARHAKYENNKYYNKMKYYHVE
jgi:Mrp family chromosome partitioning ATPase